MTVPPSNASPRITSTSSRQSSFSGPFLPAFELQSLFSDLKADNATPVIPPDITLEIGPDAHPIPAHRFVLFLHSPVLRSMYSGQFAESKEDDRCVLPLKDMRVVSAKERALGYPSFWKVLQRCYYHEVKFDDLESMFTVYEVSDFLQMTSLSHSCINEMMRSIPTNSTSASSEHILKLLEFAARHSIQKVLDACTMYISDPLNVEILSTLHEPSLSSLALKALFSHEKLAVPEILLFEVIMRRVKGRLTRLTTEMCSSGTREALESKMSEEAHHLLPLVRLPTLTMDQLCNIVAPSQLVSDSALVEAFVHVGKGYPKSDDLPLRFKPRPLAIPILKLGLEIDAYWSPRWYAAVVIGISSRKVRVRFKSDNQVTELRLPTTRIAPKGRYVKPGDLKAHSHGRELEKPIFTQENIPSLPFVSPVLDPDVDWVEDIEGT